MMPWSKRLCNNWPKTKNRKAVALNTQKCIRRAGGLSLMMAVLLLPCCAPQEAREPLPDHETVYEARDSIRQTLLLRMGHALQEANRRSEYLRRKAYSQDDRTAKELRATVGAIERSYQQIELYVQRLQQDSVLGEWYQQRNEIELELQDLGHTIRQPL